MHINKSMANKHVSIVNAQVDKAQKTVAANKKYMLSCRSQGTSWGKKVKMISKLRSEGVIQNEKGIFFQIERITFCKRFQ